MIFPLAKKNISLSQLLVAGEKSNHALVGKESHLMCSSNWDDIRDWEIEIKLYNSFIQISWKLSKWLT